MLIEDVYKSMQNICVDQHLKKQKNDNATLDELIA